MTQEQRHILAAAMDRILPAHDGPGATEANAAGYVEWLTGQGFFQPTAAPLAAGLELLDSCAAAMWERPFVDCTPAQRDAVLTRVREIPHPVAQRFFRMLIRMTLAGFLGAPDYGGNRDGVGWESIGFAPHPLTAGAARAGVEPCKR